MPCSRENQDEKCQRMKKKITKIEYPMMIGLKFKSMLYFDQLLYLFRSLEPNIVIYSGTDCQMSFQKPTNRKLI